MILCIATFFLMESLSIQHTLHYLLGKSFDKDYISKNDL